MIRPNPALLEHLGTSRLLIGAYASVGLGERRSASLGFGLEFAAHRDYREGDDTRHIDARLLARLDVPYVRQYVVERQLPVAIIIDGSRSMRYGAPDKFATAIAIAQLFAFVGLAGGDRVEIAVLANDRLQWSPRLSGVSQADWVFNWLADQKPEGTSPFGQALRQAGARLSPRSQIVLISDWWDEDAEAGLRVLGAQGHGILVLNLHAPDELDPPVGGAGRTRLRDVEDGQEIEIELDESATIEYRRLLAAWSETLRQACRYYQGSYFHVSSALNLEQFFLRDLRAAGIIS